MKRLTAKGLTSAQALGILTTVAMLPMLLYNWRHTGSLFARYVDPDALAYGVAFGIEVAVFVLALRLGQQRQTHGGSTGRRIVRVGHRQCTRRLRDPLRRTVDRCGRACA